MLRSVADRLDCTLVNKFFLELQCYLSTTATRGTVYRLLLGVETRANLSTGIAICNICGRCREMAAVGRWPLVEVPLQTNLDEHTARTTDTPGFKTICYAIVLTWHRSSAAVGDCLIRDIAPTKVSIPLSQSPISHTMDNYISAPCTAPIITE